MRESRHGIQRTRATVEAPPGDRADLAMALWESLSDDEREGELALSPEQRAPGPKFAGSCWQESDPTCCFPT